MHNINGETRNRETRRMRTIKGIVGYFRDIDPETTVNEYWVRQLVKQKKIKYHAVGRKALIDLDYFIDYLQNPPILEENDIQYGTLRKIGR